MKNFEDISKDNLEFTANAETYYRGNTHPMSYEERFSATCNAQLDASCAGDV